MSKNKKIDLGYEVDWDDGKETHYPSIYLKGVDPDAMPKEGVLVLKYKVRQLTIGDTDDKNSIEVEATELICAGKDLDEALSKPEEKNAESALDDYFRD